MITELTDLPEGVIGFEVADRIEATDYRDVILPAIERAAASGDIRFLIVFPEFHGMTVDAVWQDLKVGVDNFRAWKRVALVTDVEWMRHLTSLFGWMTPGETKVFSVKERDDAVRWLAS